MKATRIYTTIISISFGFLCFSVASFAQSSKSEKQKYDIAAFVWPSYHPDDRAKIFWPDGIGEWQTVMSNQPKYEGHEQPRYPLWGYINEADPYVAEMEINAAADHGVNVFIFDWYWYDGMPYLEGHLNVGYLKARNNDRVKFYLMWANHDVRLNWDKRNADDAFARKNNSIIWDGGIDREEFEIVANRIIEKYFSHPSYYKISGKPVFMLYDLQNFIEGLGGLEEARDALVWFRKQVKKAGFKDLELQLSMRSNLNRTYVIDDTEIGTQSDLINEFKFNSLTHYQFVHMTNCDRDYIEVLDDIILQWNKVSDTFQANYYPQVSVGWDASPRAYNYIGQVIKNNTPENFEKALQMAKKFIDTHPDQAPLITINSWNEWTETSYLQPCTMYGYGYLEAIKQIFLDGN